MNLKETAEKLFEDSKKTPLRGLRAIAEAEKYLQQAYQGRYFFELIQNVRDANKEKNQDGEVYIELEGNVLSISNTGAEFSTKGIEGITTIGASTKQSQDYIGFKGIGFKSIQEITEEPKIITRYGSVYFDRKITLGKYNDPKIKEDQVPLFYFPHFNVQKLSISEIQKGIVTKLELPIKASVTEEKIIEAFSEIQAQQLILLGNIKHLKFKTDKIITKFSINKNPQKRFIEVTENDNPSIKFKYFTPESKIQIPNEVIESLEGKEKDIFKNGSQVEINIVLELSGNGQVQPITDAKLYLFYPLQINSGFRFIIHSYFIVNPERTALRDSPLNDFLLSEIGEFIGKEMLGRLKQTKINTNKILCFNRNKDAKINVLYDSVVKELKKQRFVFDSQTKRYFSSSEVMVADGFDKGLFPDGKLGGKQLIYTDDKDVIQWLQDEFEIPYLSYEDIANQIENECKRQAKERKLGFFQKLYNYVNEHGQLNLTGRKVLITEDWKLVSSEEDVFYGGEKKNISLAGTIRKQIHFIHKGIKFKQSDFREGKSRTGITEFNTYELVRRLLKLFENSSVPNKDLLNAIFNLQPFDSKSELDIKEKILLPVKGNSKWLSPLNNPIYFDTENLKELYPNGNFIDAGFLQWTGEESSTVSPENFLKAFGVWEIPAIYIAEKPITLLREDNRNKIIAGFSGLVSRPYLIRYDRILDTPTKYNTWFTNAIIDNWSHYQSFINSKLLPPLQCYNSQSTYARTAGETWTVKLSDFIEKLTTHKWIAFLGEDETYAPNQIIGIKYLDFSQSHNQVISRYLKLLPISYDQKQNLIDSIGLIHLDGDSIDNYINLLDLIHTKFESEIPTGKDFTDFYNRILSKLVDFFYSNNQTDNIKQLGNEMFLAINDISKKTVWEKANQIFYIDDKPNYDLLPLSIKEKIQPHFTNRDKNTFGKIAAKIGKKFSNSIQKELIESDSINTSLLPSFFGYLPESIAILESKLDIILNDYFEILKTIRVFEKENIEVKISVGDSKELIISVNHFVDTDDDFNFHFSRANNSNRNKQLAESMSELFINLLGRDLRLYNSDLLRFLNSADKKEYLRDYDILEERVNEIRDKLNTSDLTANQKFWEALLTAKGISTRENIFNNQDINLPYLSKSLVIEENIIHKIQEKFNFNQTSATVNINLLVEILNQVSLTLEDINKIIFPKIDFREFYEKKLKNLKNKFEKGFDSILHSYLSNLGSDEKANYQDLLDNFKRDFQLSIPLNTLELNIESYFLESLSSQFPFLKFTRGDLQKDFSHFNPVAIYSINLNLLKASLATIEFKNEYLDNFLVENKRRSLLYFNEVDMLVESFKEWLVQFKDKNKPTEDEDALEDFLSEFSDQTAIDIEEVNTREVDVSSSNEGTSGVGNGKRFDGGANDHFKKKVGLVAEMVVYEKLKTIYTDVTWISKFASKVHKTHPGYNPEGQDGLGYDIEYVDIAGNKYFVEVKGKTDNYEVFEISRNEVEKAHREKAFYKIIFVTQVMNNAQRRIKDLGNLFMLDEGEDFLSNRKFKAVYKNFEIKFQETSRPATVNK